jgi:hypothetical protein
MRALLKVLHTPADAYKAIGAVLGFEFGRFGAEIEVSGIRFTWVDAPGEVVLQTNSNADAKRIASLLRRGGVLATVTGEDVKVSTNDIWPESRYA